jgi:hypothetical protein
MEDGFTRAQHRCTCRCRHGIGALLHQQHFMVPMAVLGQTPTNRSGDRKRRMQS